MAKSGKKNPATIKAAGAKTSPSAADKKQASFQAELWFQRNGYYLAASIAVIALILRLQNLGYLSLWVDEFWHGNRTKAFLEGGPFADIFAVETNGAVVTLLSILSSAVFGLDEWGLRLPVVLSAVALIPLTYLFVKKQSNASIALLVTLLIAFSPYLFFWSRVVRMYGMVPFTFFLLVVAAVHFFEREGLKANVMPSATDDVRKLPWKWLPLVLLTFIGSFFTGQISFLFFFSFGLYAILVWADQLRMAGKAALQLSNKYLWVSVVAIPVFILSFTSLNKVLARPLFLQLMPANLVDKILPDMNAVAALLGSEDMFGVAKTFYAVPQTDFPVLYFFALLGIPGAYFYGRKLGHFMVAFGVFPFLLLSFVFINMNLAKYLSFAYPFLLIYMAIGVYLIPDLLFRYVLKQEGNGSFFARLVLPLVFVLVFLPFKTIGELATQQKHGSVIDGKLAEWFFTNWKESVGYVMQQPEIDQQVLMSTMPDALRFYTNQKDVLHFRQNYYDVYEKGYKSNEPTGSDRSASSYEDLLLTMEANEKGWLVSDYYLYNAMTDPRARALIFERATFHPDACPDGSVQVFSWDNTKPRTQPGNLVIELGKPLGKQVSDPLYFNADASAGFINLRIVSQKLEAQGEAFVSLNNRNYIPIPPPATVDAQGYGVSTVFIGKDNLVAGTNQITFAYNPESADFRKGFVIYEIGF